MNNLLSRFRILALMAMILVSVSSAFAQQKIAIIDAGSSGSRLYVYEISKDGKSVTTLCNKKEELPLSKVDTSKGKVHEYVQTVTKLYDNKGNSPIDLYVLATAGMRYEPKEKAEKIYTHIKNAPQQIVNNFRVKDAKTISGRYEGLYAWIALNYDYKNIGSGISTTERPLTYVSGSTLGIIEIGGASMQITFAAPDNWTLSANETISRKGFSRIYSKSYLGGGVDKIYKTFGNGSPEMDYSDGNPGIQNLPNLSGMKIFGLGKPIEIVVDGIKAKGGFKNYERSLRQRKEEDKYHTLSNAYYINWLATKLRIGISDIGKPKAEVSWTKGAALDIVVNGNEPESFDYQNPN